MNGAQLGLAKVQMMQSRTLERQMAAQSGLPVRRLSVSESMLIGSWDKKQAKAANQRRQIDAYWANLQQQQQQWALDDKRAARLAVPPPLVQQPRRRLTLWQRITGRI